MRAVRGLGIAIGVIALTLAAAGGAGIVAHSEAVVVTLDKIPAPLGSGEPVRLSVSIRNRTAALVPVRGVGRSPSWTLQRRSADGGWVGLTDMAESQTAWLEPYHRERHEAQVDEPGLVRAVLHSGLHGEFEQVSAEVLVAPDDFDYHPLAHY